MNYFLKEGVSNSSLGLFNYSPELYYKTYISKEIQKKESQSLSFGSLFHALLLEPDTINDRFIVLKAKEVDGMLGEFIKILSKKDDVDELIIQEAYVKTGFKWSLETVLKNFNESKNQDYYHELVSLKDKTGISKEDYDKAIRMANTANKILIEYFDDDFYKDELELEWKYEDKELEIDESCKSKLDRFCTNLCKYVDIKTDSQNIITEYNQSFEYWKTYRQIAFYDMALDKSELSKNTLHYILAASTKSEKVMLYKVSKEWILQGYKEIHKDFENLKWHKENNLWEFPKKIYDELALNNVLTLKP